MIRALSKHMAAWQIHIAGPLLMLLLSLVVYLVEIEPLYRHFSDRHMRVSQLSEQVIRARELDATLKRTRSAASDVRAFVADHGINLESRSRLNDRFTAICALATDCGLVADGIEPQRQTVEPLFTSIALRLSGHGSYRDCLRFLEKLHSDMPHNTVAGIELSAAAGGADVTVTFNFQLVCHVAPTP